MWIFRFRFFFTKKKNVSFLGERERVKKNVPDFVGMTSGLSLPIKRRGGTVSDRILNAWSNPNSLNPKKSSPRSWLNKPLIKRVRKIQREKKNKNLLYKCFIIFMIILYFFCRPLKKQHTQLKKFSTFF